MSGNQYDLSGRAAIVTGGASGMGAATVDLLLASGVEGVIIADFDQIRGEELAQKHGPRCHFVKSDITSYEDMQRVAGETEARFGPPSILVHCAAVTRPDTLDPEQSPDVFYDVCRINQFGTYNVVKAIAPSMRKSGRTGSIVLFASIVALGGGVGSAGYLASKWAVRGMTKNFALELGPDIRVNNICPGFIETPMNLEARRYIQDIVETSPIPRMGKPEEIARTVAWLSSDHASYITGLDVIVDGGVSARVGRT